MCVAPPFLVRGKEGPEIAQPRRAEDGVDHGVGEDVGVGVALEAAIVGNLDPAENQRAPLREPVRVVANADAGAHPSGSRRRRRRSNTASSSMPQLRISLTARS